MTRRQVCVAIGAVSLAGCSGVRGDVQELQVDSTTRRDGHRTYQLELLEGDVLTIDYQSRASATFGAMEIDSEGNVIIDPRASQFPERAIADNHVVVTDPEGDIVVDEMIGNEQEAELTADTPGTYVVTVNWVERGRFRLTVTTTRSELDVTMLDEDGTFEERTVEVTN